jgi:hypothetical protein
MFADRPLAGQILAVLSIAAHQAAVTAPVWHAEWIRQAIFILGRLI